jgi:gamma-glutamyl hercynylcysteine S-oxide synthase
MTAPAATLPPRYRATVAALALGQIVCWAVLFYAFTAFVLPMQRELDWSAPLLMGAYTTGLAVSAALSFSVGAAIDRGHGRAVLACGPLVGAAGLLLWAVASHGVVLYAAWVVIGVAMAMTLYEPAFTVVTRLYPQRFREAVTAITLLGGLASTLCFPLIALLQSLLPWRWALAALALLLAAVGALHAAAHAHAATPDPAALPDATLADAFGSRAFWALTATFTSATFLTGGLWAHMVPALAAKGLSEGDALKVLVCVGPAQVAGRLLFVFFGHRFSLRAISLVTLTGLPLGVLLFALGSTLPHGQRHGHARARRPAARLLRPRGARPHRRRHERHRQCRARCRTAVHRRAAAGAAGLPRTAARLRGRGPGRLRGLHAGRPAVAHDRPMKPDAALHDAQAMRHADRELLSLALMQSRNRTLAWLARLETLDAARRLAGHIGWWQERWIARNVQRARGSAADATRAPLASIEPLADAWWGEGAESSVPDAATVRAYLEATLEATLELLAVADGDDDALHWFRAALFSEDACVLRFAALAHHEGITAARTLLPERTLRPVRPPLWFAARRWMLGSARGGCVPANEQWAHEEAVPEFEIDAQAVTWAQFAEFVEDGGYDDERWWSPAGLSWLHDDGRRTPRDVEQLRHGVLLRRFGQLVRAPAGEAATMLTCHEADAWCRWAGRRLPTEIEWELAAATGASRGLVWGDVPEWTAGRARAWPGGPALNETTWRVQRGLAWLEPRRLAHPKARRFVAPDRDDGFAGLRSCAL